jgi:hypothetical protein
VIPVISENFFPQYASASPLAASRVSGRPAGFVSLFESSLGASRISERGSILDFVVLIILSEIQRHAVCTFACQYQDPFKEQKD